MTILPIPRHGEIIPSSACYFSNPVLDLVILADSRDTAPRDTKETIRLVLAAAAGLALSEDRLVTLTFLGGANDVRDFFDEARAFETLIRKRKLQARAVNAAAIASLLFSSTTSADDITNALDSGGLGEALSLLCR